ncbi:MAG TPA: MFS transporter [Actinospica sp.]|jgi:MFS family permease|nr:MFS transporter [Actinospica sp.]
MHFARYKSVLALPGMRGFMLVSLIARIPGTAWTTALTLSLVLDRHRSYAEAGAATAAFTVGLAFGSPLLGRTIDRRGPRPVLLLTGTASLLFWNLVPVLPYSALLPLAVLCGGLQVPVMTLVRQSLAARVPESMRRQAYSLDSMAVELSFMVGPALAVLAITQLGEGTSTLRVLGFGLGLSAAVLYAYNPRMHETSAEGLPAERADGAEGSGGVAARGRRTAAGAGWFNAGFVMILAVCAACCVTLSANDVAIVAVLRGHGEIAWAGVVVIIWCAASMLGGFVHGAMRRPLPMTVLLLLLGGLSIPVGVAGSWWLLCLLVIPAGVACAPTIASTVDAASRAVPASRRGQAMGLHGAALTVGSAIGAPLIGVVIDRAGPGWGMAAIGLLVCLVAIAGIVAQHLQGRAATSSRMFQEHAEAPQRELEGV